MKPIVQHGEPVLRELAQTVAARDVLSSKVKQVIADMKAAMAAQPDGVAIAAPQIGVPLRIFVVSDKLMKEADATYTSIGRDLVFINPSLTKLSRDKHEVEEGCLSVRYKYGKVKRSVKATVRGLNELGERVERGASGLLAQVFQHEVDHLDGILFIDKATDLVDLPQEDIERLKNYKNEKAS